MHRWIIAIPAFGALLVTACSGPEPVHADPSGLVQFSLPDGWAEQSRSSGIRFSRADASGERTVLTVSARPRGGRDPAAQRELRLSQIRQQGFDVLIDEMREIEGWRVWESAAGPSSDGPIMHAFHFFSDAVQAEVSLIAAAADYARYEADVRLVAESLTER